MVESAVNRGIGMTTLPERDSPQESLRVALVHVSDYGGGAERSVLTLHRSLLAQGHDSRLFVASRQLNEPGVIEIERHRSIPGLLRITSRLEQQGIQNLYAPWFRNLHQQIGEVDVVHLHSLWKVRHGFADLTGVRRLADRYPTVMTLRDGWMLTGHCACPIGCDRWTTGCGQCPDLARAPAISRDFSHLNWRRKRSVIQRSDLQVTAVSTWLKDQVLQSPIFAGKSVHVVHNSVDADAFSPGSQMAARESLGLPKDAFIVLLAGQSIEGFHQGISQHAAQALNQLNDRDIHTMLVGRSAAAVAATLQTPSVVVPFRHTQEEMAQCYQAADLTIVPSEYETFGRVAAESLFCGTPVLAFATGGLSDIVTAEICGRLVPTGDVTAMAAGIAELKAHPEILANMRRQCVPHVRSRFNTTEIAQQYVNVYHQVISERNHGRIPEQSETGWLASIANLRSEDRWDGNSSTEMFDGKATTVRRPAAGISCIIPAWNCEPWLSRAVESVLSTDYLPIEILIVDDGSTDGTLTVAQQLADQYPDRVKVLRHSGGANKGVSASRNLGLQQCSGEWICFLDADDYVYPHRFESALDILSTQPDVDGVHQLAEMVFPTEEASKRWWKNSPYFGFDRPIEPYNLLNSLLAGKCWATSAIVFRRTLLDRCGLFHEQLKVAEDCHLWFRMASVGKIVSGDLTRPVSAYWRRLDSAYQPSPTQRLQMMHSMTSFLAWLQNADVEPTVRSTARKAVSQYVLNGLTNARFEKDRKLAWTIAWQGLQEMPSLSIDPGFCGQVARLAAGR